MFDQLKAGDPDTVLAGLTGMLTTLNQDVADGVRIDRIRLLEELKAAAAAAQIRETAAFVCSQRAGQIAAGVPAAQAGQGVAAQIGLARRLSPYHARQQVGWATILISELPHTYAALQAGVCTEWRAMIVARETAWLSREDRLTVDAEIAPQLSQWGDRRVEAETKKTAYRLDPHGYVNRLAAAVSERRVTARPAPDMMCRVTGLLPVAHGVGVYAALRKHADSLIAQGDTRTRGQIMADTFYERLTGQASAEDVPVEVELIMTDQALFGDTFFGPDFFAAANDTTDTDNTDSDGDVDDLTGADVDANADADAVDAAGDDSANDVPGAGDTADSAGRATSSADRRDNTDNSYSTNDTGSAGRTVTPIRTAGSGSPSGGSAGVNEPAYLVGYGWIPAEVARHLVLNGSDTAARWIRRLYTRPDTGQLIAMDSRRRFFPPALSRFIRLRDHTCRTPYCDAPIRHTDHVTSNARGGPTTLDNGQGACAACNYWKEAPGWTMTASAGGAGDHVTITTPTGHHYTSRPPDPPGTPARTGPAINTAPQIDTRPVIDDGPPTDAGPLIDDGPANDADRGTPMPQRVSGPHVTDQVSPKAA